MAIPLIATAFMSGLSGGGGGSPLASSSAGGGTTNQTSSAGGGLDPTQILGQFNSILQGVKCWGASWTPQKAQALAARIVPAFVAKLQNIVQSVGIHSTTAVNDAILQFKREYQHPVAWMQSPSNKPTGCTKETLSKMIPELDNAYKKALSDFKAEASQKGFAVSMQNSTFYYKSANEFNLPITYISISANPIVNTVSNGVAKVSDVAKTVTSSRAGGGAIVIAGIIGVWALITKVLKPKTPLEKAQAARKKQLKKMKKKY